MINQVGTIQPLDESGHILNLTSHTSLQRCWRQLLETVLKSLVESTSNIHSIYVRGSVAVGRAIKDVSDLDLIVVAFNDYEKNQAACEVIKNNHSHSDSFCKKIDISLCTDEMLLSPSDTSRFFIKTQSLHIYGRDISHAIPSFGIDTNLISHCWMNDKGVLEMLIKHLSSNDVEINIQEWCVWLMKMIVRNAFLTVMTKAQCYTRDLWPCYDIFSHYHLNEISDSIYAALKLAVEPSKNSDEVIGVARRAMDHVYGVALATAFS